MGVSFMSMTKARATLKEGTSVGEMPSLDWPVVVSGGD